MAQKIIIAISIILIIALGDVIFQYQQERHTYTQFQSGVSKYNNGNTTGAREIFLKLSQECEEGNCAVLFHNLGNLAALQSSGSDIYMITQAKQFYQQALEIRGHPDTRWNYNLLLTQNAGVDIYTGNLQEYQEKLQWQQETLRGEFNKQDYGDQTSGVQFFDGEEERQVGGEGGKDW
jgi:hypothetical protein